ncbi:hypothetical protein IPA_07245 [Ignicoccus pacificus DSM 13166]|uniref:Uncharacterized protein n=1 Tax=Ignicoccus pacificus DSM 13166 TaxID=940294 RepID=A0A977KCT3_9CREN|nr:hypothetical protein IPA_07245 [Ignicoccus pacificus DSM 13166]
MLHDESRRGIRERDYVPKPAKLWSILNSVPPLP